MVDFYHAILGAVLLVVLLWLWRLGGGGVRRNRATGVLALGVLAAFFGPPLWQADWERLAQVAAVGLVAGAVVLGYGWLLGRARAAARAREEARTDGDG